MDSVPANMTLFKYRAVNDHLIDLLQEGYLYFSNPATFNDPFEFRAYLDQLSNLKLSRKDLEDELAIREPGLTWDKRRRKAAWLLGNPGFRKGISSVQHLSDDLRKTVSQAWNTLLAWRRSHRIFHELSPTRRRNNLDPLQSREPGERVLPPVEGQEAAGRNLEGAGDVEDVHRPASGARSLPAKAMKFPDQLNAVDLGKNVEPAPLACMIVAKLAFRLLLGPFVPKDLEVERVRELGFLEFPDGERLILFRDAGLNELGTGLEDVELHEGTGIEVDHQRPSRSALTVSCPVIPFAEMAVARWSSHFTIRRGSAETMRTTGFPRLSTSKVSPRATCSSISAHCAFISRTETVFIW
jgi:hypothetical protein